MQRNKRLAAYSLVLLAVVTLISACDKDDDTRVPSYITELVEARTGHDANVMIITLDNGQTYPVTNPIKASTADTTYRCLVNYTLLNNEATIYGLKHIFSALPRPSEVFKSCPADPVKFISSWLSGRYMNIKIGLMTSGKGTHRFAFAEDSIVTNSEGQEHIYVTLLHQRPEIDDESYTEEMFLSMPLYDYRNPTHVTITLPTYEGMVTVER